MTKVCLIRHGETDWNLKQRLQGTSDIPLNDTGIKQAEESRIFLSNSDWDVMITSPLKRAKQTAEIINKDLQIPLYIMDEFKERFFGDAEGLTVEERKSIYPNRNYPNQEDWHSFRDRVIKGMQKIDQKYKDKLVLIVAHGAVINAILSTFSNGQIGSGKTKLLNACLNNIHFENDQWIIKDYNEVSHLSKLKS